MLNSLDETEEKVYLNKHESRKLYVNVWFSSQNA